MNDSVLLKSSLFIILTAAEIMLNYQTFFEICSDTEKDKLLEFKIFLTSL